MADPIQQAKTEDQLRRLHDVTSELAYLGIPVSVQIHRTENGQAVVGFQFPLEFNIMLLELVADYIAAGQPGDE